jgi:F0F1-type ATP synthase membrane subunit c/vacuolar-type H+-ATPase subunit K
MFYALSFFFHACPNVVSFVLRANAQQPKLFVGMILILIFAEALALCGIIVGIILFLLLFKCVVLLLAFVLVSYL